MRQMFGLSYHCGNCDDLVSRLNQGKCPTCGSTSVVSSGWYQLSVEERSEWIERINGRRSQVDQYRLDQPGIRERVVLPPVMSCTSSAAQPAVMAPPREIARPVLANPLLLLWAALTSWISSLFAAHVEATEQAVSMVQELEPLPLARMTGPVRPRVRPTRPLVWSREHAPRARVQVLGARTTARRGRNSRGIPSPPRRRRLRTA